MASIGKGDGRAAFRSSINSSSHLPPRSPCFPNMGSTSFHSNTSFFTGGKSFTHNVGQRQHQRTPSASFLMEQPSWLDDLLEDSEVPSRKVSHRRSASDSFTFSEAHGNLYKISNIAEEEEFDCSGVATLNSQGFKDFNHYNEDQLMSLYVEIEQLQKKQNLPVSGTVTPILCSSQLENARTRIKGTSASTAESCTAADSTSGTGASSDGMLRHLDCEAEVRRAGDRDISDQYCVRDESSSVAVPNDPNLDSKQAKRHSAQRSRVRKLQYIAELESSVNALQAEVSALSPQMTYVERQLVLLKADNKALKQRVNFLLQDKKLKEAQIEIQKREVQKYGKLYQIQLQRQLQQNQNHKQHEEYQKLGEHRDESFEKSLPSDLDLHPDEFSNLNLGSQLANSRPLVSDALVGLMKNLSGLSIGTGTNMGPSLHGLKTGIPSSCTVGAGGKSLEGRLTAGSALMASDFMIQNS